MEKFITAPERFSSRLPGTPCTPEMRSQIEDIARREGVTMTMIQRAAMSLFLSEYVRFSTNESEKS